MKIKLTFEQTEINAMKNINSSPSDQPNKQNDIMRLGTDLLTAQFD